jgi:hypothetical protein
MLPKKMPSMATPRSVSNHANRSCAELAVVHSWAQFLQQRLETTAPGLTATEAEKRLIQYGYNRLRPPCFDALRTPE